MNRVDLLVDILFDETARIDERDDAAIDLGDYNDNKALNALLTMATSNSSKTNFIITGSCGESIAQIWVKRDYFDLNSYKKMIPIARREVYGYISYNKPEWVKKYNLDELN